MGISGMRRPCLMAALAVCACLSMSHIVQAEDADAVVMLQDAVQDVPSQDAEDNKQEAADEKEDKKEREETEQKTRKKEQATGIKGDADAAQEEQENKAKPISVAKLQHTYAALEQDIASLKASFPSAPKSKEEEASDQVEANEAVDKEEKKAGLPEEIAAGGGEPTVNLADTYAGVQKDLGALRAELGLPTPANEAPIKASAKAAAADSSPEEVAKATADEAGAAPKEEVAKTTADGPGTTRFPEAAAKENTAEKADHAKAGGEKPEEKQKEAAKPAGELAKDAPGTSAEAPAKLLPPIPAGAPLDTAQEGAAKESATAPDKTEAAQADQMAAAAANDEKTEPDANEPDVKIAPP